VLVVTGKPCWIGISGLFVWLDIVVLLHLSKSIRNARKGAKRGVRDVTESKRRNAAKILICLKTPEVSVGISTEAAKFFDTSFRMANAFRRAGRDSSFDLETAKGCHKVIDLAGRGGFAGFEVGLNT
jgi:hypothetical protein